MNIAIIDDDRAVRKTLRKIIENENIGKVVFEDDNGAYVEKIDFEKDQIDMIMSDLIMPVRSGIEAIKDLKKTNYKGIVVMLSQVQEKELIGETYALGVEYYINKPIYIIEVVSIFEKIKEKISLRQIAEKHRINEFKALLTPTELKILKLISQRLTQAQIAEELYITIQTVKNHITKILRKTQSHNSNEAARKAKEMQLI